MIVLDGTVRGKPLICVVIVNLIVVLANENYQLTPGIRCGTGNRERNLPVNKQITIYLSRKNPEVYYFENDETYDRNISVTLTPCATKIKWSFTYESHNESEKINEMVTNEDGSNGNTEEGECDSMKTVASTRARKGCYFLRLSAPEGNARVNVYLSMDRGGPCDMKKYQMGNLTVIHQTKQKLKISWIRSHINSHVTSYCVVISRKKEFLTLCSAEEESFVLRDVEKDAPINMNNLEKLTGERGENTTAVRKKNMPKNTWIICVEQRLQVTLAKIKRKESYYISLFAINRNTNFTVPYGSKIIRYNYKPKPITLVDGGRKIIDLKKHNGEVSFKFKAYKKRRDIYFYILVCGGAVEAEFTRKDRGDRLEGKNQGNLTELLNLRVFGYKRFNFSVPGNYFLKISVPDTDERTRVEYVEVFATMDPKNYPLPAIPEKLELYEYQSRRSCNSITIGWMPEPDTTINKYCVIVRENKRIDFADKFRASFQCHLDGRNGGGFSSFPSKVNKKLYVYRKCKKQYIKQKLIVTNHTITNLKPGRSYTIQVTVEKKNGRTLSYKLLKAVTKHSCDV